jgi:hypothetical protein
MGLVLLDQRPNVTCDVCFNRLALDETFILSYADLQAVTLVCEPCGDKLIRRWPDKSCQVMEAIYYFRLLMGRSLSAKSNQNPRGRHDD